MKNEGFEVLKTKHIFFFLMFNDFFPVKNEGFEVLKTEKNFFF